MGGSFTGLIEAVVTDQRSNGKAAAVTLTTGQRFTVPPRVYREVWDLLNPGSHIAAAVQDNGDQGWTATSITLVEAAASPSPS